MAGEIDGPVVKIGADASKVETTLTGIKGKFDTLASSANSSLSGIGKNFDLSNVSKQIDQVSDKLKNIGSTLTVAALPFEAFGALAVKSFSDFEQNIGKIHTLLPDATKSEIDKIGSDLKEFSAQYGADVNKATQAYYDALSAGVSQDKALPFLQAAQKAGTAGMSDVSVAVDGLTSVLNAYQLGTEKAADVSDTMFQTVNLGKIEFDPLANNIGKVTPTASSFKVGFQDVGAAIAQITSLGVSPEETMTGLKNLIKDLGTEGSDLNKKFQEISGQGFTQFMQSGGSLVDVVGMLKKNSDETGESFFNMTGSFESANTLAMLGGSAFENYAGFLDKIQNSAGATDKAYSAMSDTMAFSMDQLKSQTQTMMIDVGAALAPSVKEFTQWLKDNAEEIKNFAVNVTNAAVPAIEKLFDIVSRLMSAFNNLDPNTKSLLATLLGGGIAAAAIGGPAMYAAGTVLGPVSTLLSMLSRGAISAGVSTEITAIGTAASTATPLVSGLFTLLANPVTLAVGAGLIAAYATNLGDFRNNVNDIVKDIGSAASNISTGNYETAGEECAAAFGDALETGVDLAVATIGSLPVLDETLSKLKTGFDTAVTEMSKGFVDHLSKSVSGMVINAPHLLFTEEGKAELTAAIKSTIANIDLSAEGTIAMRSFASAFTGLDTLLNPMLQGIFSSIQESYNNLIFSLPDFLPGITQYKQYLRDTAADAEELKRKLGLNTPQTANLDFSNYNSAHNAISASSSTSSGKSPAQALAEERNLRLEDAQKMLDSNETLRIKYEKLTATQDTSNTAINSGTQAVNQFTTAVNTATTTAQTKSKAELAVDATTAQIAAESRSSGGSGATLDLFSTDPAQYLKQELQKSLDRSYHGSIQELEADYASAGKSINDKIHQIFNDAKSEGLGGDYDFNTWFAKASPALGSFKTSLSDFSSIIGDGNVKLSEAARYLNDYNQKTGQQTDYSQKQISQSQEMLSAIMQISAAQSTYSQYMSDGSLSAQEAADMNSRLAEINRILGDAGITAESGVSGIPGALQSLASYAQDAVSKIENAISNANAAVASANAYVASATNNNTSNKSTVNNTVNMNNMTFSESYTPKKVVASAIQGLIAGG